MQRDVLYLNIILSNGFSLKLKPVDQALQDKTRVL